MKFSFVWSVLAYDDAVQTRNGKLFQDQCAECWLLTVVPFTFGSPLDILASVSSECEIKWLPSIYGHDPWSVCGTPTTAPCFPYHQSTSEWIITDQLRVICFYFHKKLRHRNRTHRRRMRRWREKKNRKSNSLSPVRIYCDRHAIEQIRSSYVCIFFCVLFLSSNSKWRERNSRNGMSPTYVSTYVSMVIAHSPFAIHYWCTKSARWETKHVQNEVKKNY